MQHVIKRQVVDLHVDKRLDAFQVQDLISHYYNNEIIPALEKAFDVVSSNDEVVQIDRLEIDLGEFLFEDLKHPKLGAELKQKIAKLVEEAYYSANIQLTAARNSVEISACHQWLFYIQHGFLNWNSVKTDATWYRSVLEALAVDMQSITELRRTIASNSESLKRIVFDHPEDFLIKLVEILTAENQATLGEEANKLLLNFALEHQSVTPAGLKQKIWMQILDMTASGQNRLTTQDIVKRIRDETFPPKPEIGELQLRLSETVTDDEIYTAHAGLVLLHPFLNNFFARLKITDNNDFKSIANREKSIYLLYYLATGSLHPKEYELVIPKLLCDYPLQKALAPVEDIAEAELEEADNLLRIVVDKWEKLRSTSIGGLREAFLQRRGKIHTKNDEVFIQVEPNSIDILLDYLPWNLGIIKLPWKKQVIRVEWRVGLQN